MKFTKMHGLGNDYIFVDCFTETVTDPSRTAQLLSPAHFGVGADGLILIEPSAKADCRMRMFNADGTEGRMCGNGIRCVGKDMYDHGRAVKVSRRCKSPPKTTRPPKSGWTWACRYWNPRSRKKSQ